MPYAYNSNKTKDLLWFKESLLEICYGLDSPLITAVFELRTFAYLTFLSPDTHMSEGKKC